MEALKRIVLRGSEMRPLIIAVEDLHWVDRSSEDTLKFLLETISGAQVMLIFTYRPDYVHAWGGKSYHSQVTLNRLSNREALAMAAHLLGTENISGDIEELILEKTEGIPFFVEEFIKSIRDLEIIEWKDSGYYLAKDVRDLAIPGTIQDVIMARVDSLPEGAKSILQIGSVIEREFSYELVKRVSGMPEKDLLSHLSVLRDAELLYERGIFPDSSYVFKHVLTREVVYDSILASRKKRLHEDIGNAIEEIHKDNLDEHYAILARHYITGEDCEKGAEYSKLAGRQAEKAGSLKDAISYGEKRIFCLERLPQTEDVQKKLIDTRTILGLYNTQLNYHVTAKEVVAPILELAIERGDRRRVSQIYSILGSYSFQVEDDFPTAFKFLEDSLEIANELGDILSITMVNISLGSACAQSANYEKALYHFKRVLEINEATNTLWGISILKSAIGMWIYDNEGRVALGYAATREALDLAEKSGDILSRAQAYIAHGYSCYFRGHLEEAQKYFLVGVDLCETINLYAHLAVGYFWLGHVYFDAGEYKKSLDYLRSVSWLAQQELLSTSYRNLFKVVLTRSNVMIGDTSVDLDMLHSCYSENKVRFIESDISRFIGEILLNIEQPRTHEAGDWIMKAIEADTRNGMRFHLAKDYALYADFYKRKGDISKTKENFNKAIEIFKECGADGWVTKYEEELKAL
jgi:tetratricopeptide (TPR) repeat protein